MSDTTPDSAKRVVGFVRFLRNEQYRVGVTESQSVARALLDLNLSDIDATRHALRALCCRSEEEWQRFDPLFQRFWFPERESEQVVSDPIRRALTSGGGFAGMGAGVDNPDIYDSGTAAGGGAARQTTITRADFRFLGDKRAMRRAEQLAEALATRLPNKPRRRRKLSTVAGQLALRPTLRRSIRYGGTPLDPRYWVRQKEPPTLIILHDVSHSMTFNNPLLFRFTRGLVRRFATVEAFVFHTQLFHVTPMYREASLMRMREQLEARNHLWLGGTCIADSLAEFRSRFGKATITPRSRVIIISDGCDANGADQLAGELTALRTRCHKIYWLNPMLERAGVDPHSAAVEHIRANVDELLPAHSLQALQQSLFAMQS